MADICTQQATKKQPNINKKATQNQSKIYQESIQNRSKLGSEGLHGGPWGPAGRRDRFRHHFEPNLGASWGPQGHLKALLSTCNFASEPLPQISAPLGVILGAFGVPKSIIFGMSFGIRCLKDVDGFWKQNGTKLPPKWRPTSMPTSKVDFLKRHRFP